MSREFHPPQENSLLWHSNGWWGVNQSVYSWNITVISPLSIYEETDPLSKIDLTFLVEKSEGLIACMGTSFTPLRSIYKNPYGATARNLWTSGIFPTICNEFSQWGARVWVFLFSRPLSKESWGTMMDIWTESVETGKSFKGSFSFTGSSRS